MEAIRDAQRPKGEKFDLAGKASRLKRSIEVAEKWIEAAMTSEAPSEMVARAETLHDEHEEELSRVVWAMEVNEERKREEDINERRPEEERVKDARAVARVCSLSNSLMEAYYTLSQAPQKVFGADAERRRYRLMGALLAANDASDAELKRLDPHAEV